MVSEAINNRMTCLCDESEHVAPIEVVSLHVTRREVLDPAYWPISDMLLLPTSRKVRLKSNPGIVATCRVRAFKEGERTFIRADAEDYEWVGDAGESFVCGLPEQLEGEELALKGL
jgi:hypothetical protein